MSYTVVECPECGGEMNIRSKRCKRCVGKKTLASRPDQIDTCPICGGPKNKKSKTCKGCQYKRPKRTNRRRVPQLKAVEDPSHDWMMSFCGFFMGDGHVDLRSSNHGKNVGLRLTISQRLDNRFMLEDIQRKLGGKLSDHKQKGELRISHWRLSGFDEIEPVLEELAASPIPCKKREECRIALEFLAWRRSLPIHLTEEQRAKAFDFVQRIRDLRVFNVPG